MPELPDVEAFRRVVARHAAGHRIERVTAPAPDVLRNTTPQALGRAMHHRRFAEPARHGKWLFAPTDEGDGPLVVLHFAMTGFLAWEPVGTPRDRHDRVIFVCADGELRFHQMRKLGGVWLARDDTERDAITGPRFGCARRRPRHVPGRACPTLAHGQVRADGSGGGRRSRQPHG